MSKKLQIVECVPNFSEGKRQEVIDSIAAKIRSIPEVTLLDYSMDANHNRSVFTFVGSPVGCAEAAFQGAKEAVAKIDLNNHQGEHPRIGAVDVIPFIPIADCTMEECVKLAYSLGEKVWKELELPVYFYEAAAKHPARRNLAEIRKGNYEGLKTEVAKPERHPDLGNPSLHPTAGAVVIGARNFLVAFNVNLGTSDIGIAKKIAKIVREKDGGLKNVKAMGVALSDRNLAQVSMNLVNCDETPIYRVVETIRFEAARHGVTIIGTEIVGLIPLKYAVNALNYYMQLENFNGNQILESNL